MTFVQDRSRLSQFSTNHIYRITETQGRPRWRGSAGQNETVWQRVLVHRIMFSIARCRGSSCSHYQLKRSDGTAMCVHAFCLQFNLVYIKILHWHSSDVECVFLEPQCVSVALSESHTHSYYTIECDIFPHLSSKSDTCFLWLMVNNIWSFLSYLLYKLMDFVT